MATHCAIRILSSPWYSLTLPETLAAPRSDDPSVAVFSKAFETWGKDSVPKDALSLVAALAGP